MRHDVTTAMMIKWTEAEFQRVALNTRLKDRTLDACKAVLVEGLQGNEAADLHKMFPQQVSRAVATLKETRESMLESAQARASGDELLKLTAAQVAKNILGQDLSIKDAERGKSYDGPVIVNTHGFAVQRVGRSGVIHDLGQLASVPGINLNVSISYPKGAGQALVEEKVKSLGVKKEVGR